MAITLADVARKACVSTAAVSNALRKNARDACVRESTHARILAAAKELRYQPNPFAASLRTRRTRTLALFLPGDIRAFFYHPNNALRFGSLVAHIASLGYRITLLDQKWAFPPDPRLVDGCLFLGWIAENHLAEVERLAAQIPVLCALQPVSRAIRLNQDESNSRRVGARLAAVYLYGLGHRRIAIVDIRQHDGSVSRTRLSVFESLARQRRLVVRLSHFGERWEERLYPSCEAILALKPLPTAVVALDDDHARVLIDHLTLTGQRVPRHVSVFSGDSTPGGFQSVPPLTGIQYGRDAAHRLLVEQFIEIVEARSSADKIVLPPPAVQLVEGQSCRAWKGKLP